jgi:hypothetical protein
MKRTILATLLALSIPAAAAADEYRPAHQPPPAAPATVRADRRDVLELERLLARYDEAAARRDRRDLARLEPKLLAAIDGELAEARAALRRGDRSGAGRLERRREAQVRADLGRLTALRAEFADLQGRFGWRATQRKQAVVAEVSRLARADLAWRPVPLPAPRPGPYAWNDHR